MMNNRTSQAHGLMMNNRTSQARGLMMNNRAAQSDQMIKFLAFGTKE
jgi:hypothetical protein